MSFRAVCVMICLGVFVPGLFSLSLVRSAIASSLPVSVAAENKSAEEIEYEVKAAFIYNFMRFIDWPEEKLSANRQYQKDNNPGADEKSPLPMLIGIVGKNPFGKAFTPILDKKIGERPIQLIEFDGYESYQRAAGSDVQALEAYRKKNGTLLARCDMLFFSVSESHYDEKLLSLTGTSAAVTLSDIPNFAEHGGMIGFVMENKKVRFDINLESVEKEKIKIRSQLLELARMFAKRKEQTLKRKAAVSRILNDDAA